jgi:hypothetical protein
MWYHYLQSAATVQFQVYLSAGTVGNLYKPTVLMRISEVGCYGVASSYPEPLPIGIPLYAMPVKGLLSKVFAGEAGFA